MSVNIGLPENTRMKKQKTVLNTGWEWRLARPDQCPSDESLRSITDWAPASFSPSVIQLELLHNGLIPDPNVGENEAASQWPGLVDWEYRCFFPSPVWVFAFRSIELAFEGLDTFATVSVNGQEILISDNMFVPHSINVQGIIKPPGEVNEMTILFESPWKKGVELEKKYGVRKAPSGTPKRMHIRKAQCHWGWDFGSRMLSIGPYKPIHLHGFDSSIVDVHISTDISRDLKKATVSIRVTASSPEYATNVEVDIVKPNGQISATQTVVLVSGVTSTQFVVHDPELWWPNGQGEQPLYHAIASLQDHSEGVIDLKDIRFGIRTIELVQQPLSQAPGETFMFRVNGRNIFAQGGNWVPGDTLLPRMTRDKYFEWIRLAKFAHHNMIRVWGGGTYETDDFWDACDEAGILVWQDFAFACGDYPLHSEFIHNFEREVKTQILRVRNRASLALLCGGNEDFCFEEFIWHNHYDHEDTKGPFENTSFPQRKIYFEILPPIVAGLAPHVQYWVNSPWGGKTSSNDPTVGNVHEWNVWHIMQRPYQDYQYLGGRFVTEFGMAAHPSLRTLAQFVPNPSSRHPQTPALAWRSKGGDQVHKTAGYLASNIRYDSTNLANFAFATQIVQSEALSFALTHWKRKFIPGNEECSGALIWQMNEVGPAINWSYIDYFLRPKPAFYGIRRALAPISVGIRRSAATLPDDSEAPPLLPVPKFEIFAHNSTSAEVCCRLVLRAYDLRSLQPLHIANSAIGQDFTLPPGRNTELWTLTDDSWTSDCLVVLEANLMLGDGECSSLLARTVNWPEPYYLLPLAPETKVTAQIHRGRTKVEDEQSLTYYERQTELDWEDIVTLNTNYPVKSVWIEALAITASGAGNDGGSDDEVLWEDNMVDLLPSPSKGLSVRTKGLKGRDVTIRFLHHWELEKA